MLHLLWIVPLVLIIAFLASPRFRGDIAESRTRRILANGLEKSRYTLLNDVELPAGGGTVHVDHIVVSRFGVFVIESWYASGTVSGTEFQDRWKQERWGRTKRFDNPVHQNAVQAETLGRLLGMPLTKIHPVVVLTGHAGMRSPAPNHMVSAEQLIRHIRTRGTHVLEPEQAERALKAIEEVRVNPGGRSALSRWALLNSVLFAALLAGLWLAFFDEIREAHESWLQYREQQESPGLFHADGSRKTGRELWEDSLICAWSGDTGRCACYEPNGDRVEIELSRCRALAERGSVLKQ